jgi:hypothetical protein
MRRPSGRGWGWRCENLVQRLPVVPGSGPHLRGEVTMNGKCPHCKAGPVYLKAWGVLACLACGREWSTCENCGMQPADYGYLCNSCREFIRDEEAAVSAGEG